MGVIRDNAGYSHLPTVKRPWKIQFMVTGARFSMITESTGPERGDGYRKAVALEQEIRDRVKAAGSERIEEYKRQRVERDPRARQTMLDLMEGRDPGAAPNPTEKKLGTVLNDLDRLSAGKKSAGFYKTTLNQIRRLMEQQLPHPIRAVTAGDIRRACEQRKEESSATTANRMRAVLHAAFELAIQDEAVEWNKVQRVKPFKVPKKEAPKPGRKKLWRTKKTPFPMDKIREVAVACDEVCPDGWLGRMFFFTIATGCRSGEAEKLLWGDIAEDYSSVIFRDRKNDDDEGFLIPEYARPMIKSWGRQHPDAHVFTYANGSPVKGKTRAKWFKSAQLEAGMRQPYGWHSIRKLAGQHARDLHGLGVAQAGLGHAQIGTTERSYAQRISPRDKELAAASGDDLLEKHWPGN